MIKQDQPSIFGGSVIAAVSSRTDGNMSFNYGDRVKTLSHRMAFLDMIGISIEHTTLVQVTYGEAKNFARYKVITDDYKAEGMAWPVSDTIADALVVTQPGHGLFLPLADCAGLIIHDPVKDILMVSHVGRHSAEIDGARRSIEYLKNELNCEPKNLRVWVSPAVGKATYPLHARDGKSLHEVIREQLLDAGVIRENTQFSNIDTATTRDYFSHSQFLAGHRDSDGRFAIVAMMTEQGEPAA